MGIRIEANKSLTDEQTLQEKQSRTRSFIENILYESELFIHLNYNKLCPTIFLM